MRPAAVAALFEEDGNWRDVLAFTWHLTPVVGAVAIAGTMVGRQQAVEARGFGISPDRTPPRLVTRLGRECIEAIICFETKVGRGEGALRLTADANGDYRAWVLSTCLEELEGFEEQIGDKRPSGAAYSRNFGGDNWEDARRKAAHYEDHDPTVLWSAAPRPVSPYPRASINLGSTR